MTDEPTKQDTKPSPLPEPFRSMCVGLLTRVGGTAWAEHEVDTPDFIEEAEKIIADVFHANVLATSR